MAADMAAGKEAGTPQSRPPSMFGMLGGKSSKVGGGGGRPCESGIGLAAGTFVL